MSECGRLKWKRYEAAIRRACLQAFKESGLPDHPGGDCPTADCPCEAMTDAMEDRAIELAAAELGIDPALLRA